MKKFVILFLSLSLIIGFIVFKYFIKPKYEDDKYTRFYTAEMKQKYPELKDINNVTPYFGALGDNPYDYPQNEKGLIGVYDNVKGKLIIPQKYKEIKACRFPYSLFFNAVTGKYKEIIYYNGDVVYKTKKYDELNCGYESWGGILTKKNDKYGMVFYNGKEVLKPIYDDIKFQENKEYSGGYYYIVKKNDSYGIFNNKGEKILPLKKRKLAGLYNNLFIIESEDLKQGIINNKNKIIIPEKYYKILYKTAHDDSHYFVACENYTNCSILDENGGIITSGEIGPDVTKLSDDYYAVGREQREINIIDKKGNKVSKKSFQMIIPLSDKYAIYKEFGKNGGGLGVIDFQGNIIMNAMSVSNIIKITDNELIKVKVKNYGIIYKNKYIAEPIFKQIYLFKGHVLLLTDENLYYVSSFDDFVKNNGNLEKCHKYLKKQYKKVDDNCFKFIKEDGTEDIYCSQNTEVNKT